jgi:hypothetical protein
MTGMPATLMFNEREFNIAGFVRFMNGPVAAADIGRVILNHGKKQAHAEYQKSKGSTQSHDFLLFAFSKVPPAVPKSPFP